MKVITIGRSSDNNNVVINDNRVSRSHLQIVKDDNGNCYAIDLGSTNGTFVNGKRISGKTLLQKGDVVVIGNTTLAWENYFVDKTGDNSESVKPNVEKPNKRKMYIIIVSVLLICIVVGVVCAILYNKEQNKKEQKYNETKKQTQEAILNYSNEKRKEAEEAAQQAEADRIKAENEKAEALKKANNASAEKDNAMKKVDKANAEKNAALNEKKQADERARQAEQDAYKANDEREKALRDKKQAEREADKAKEAQLEAEKARKNAEESEKLTEEFYDLISTMNERRIKRICEELKLKDGGVSTLKNHFKTLDNKTKTDIIKMMKDTEVPEQEPQQEIKQDTILTVK